MITVIGLGPGDPGLVTQDTVAALVDHPVRFLRTTRHPTAHLVRNATSFDEQYEAAETFDAVYTTITERLLEAEHRHGRVLYAVPGSPLVLEQTVQRLRRSAVELRILPALSFLDLAWDRLGIDPVEERVRLIDGHSFARSAAGEPGPLLVAHAHANWVLSEIKLAIDAGPEQRAVLLQGLGTPGERIVEVAWPDLDRTLMADHLTSVFIASVTAPVAGELVRSVELMHRLRQECPWDREQTHESLRRHLLEETYEVLEAIDGLAATTGEEYHHLQEELGDLWFQVLFHAELAAEAGQFTIADVARNVHDKLVARHPHVFGDAEAADAAAVLHHWERAKASEKARASAMDGIPTALPALALAEKVLKRGVSVAPVALTDAELIERIGRVEPSEDGIADGLLALVELARRSGVDAEGALRAATRDAIQRFRSKEPPAPGDVWVFG